MHNANTTGKREPGRVRWGYVTSFTTQSRPGHFFSYFLIVFLPNLLGRRVLRPAVSFLHTYWFEIAAGVIGGLILAYGLSDKGGM